MSWVIAPGEEGPRAGGGHRPAQGFAVHRDPGQRPGRPLLGQVPGSALFALGRPGRGSHDRCWGDTTNDVGGETTARPVQRLSVKITQDTAEGSFAGHQIAPGQGVPARPEPGQDLLRGPCRPLPDRRHTVAAHHQRRARRQRQHHHQPVAPTAAFPPVRDLREPREQR